jgi:hypothetical protein
MNTDCDTALQWKFINIIGRIHHNGTRFTCGVSSLKTNDASASKSSVVSASLMKRHCICGRPLNAAVTDTQPCIEFALRKKLVYSSEVFPYESLKGAVDIGLGRIGISDRRLPCDSCC